MSFPPIPMSTQLVISYWIIFILSLPLSLSPLVCYFKFNLKWVKFAPCTKFKRFKGCAVKSKSCPHTCLPAAFALLGNSKVANCFSFTCLRCIFHLIILLNSSGWRWLIRSYRLHVCTSVKNDLYVALWARHPKSNHLPSPNTWIPLPPPIPSGDLHTVVCVYVFQFYVLWMSDIIWFLTSLYFLKCCGVVTKWSQLNYLAPSL